MTSSAQPSDDEAFWRRPAPGDSSGPAPDTTVTPPARPYPGPPSQPRPPYGWRPPTVVQPPAPRPLPAQDSAGLDRTERTAAMLTRGIALVAAAVMFVLMLLLCGRWLV